MREAGNGTRERRIVYCVVPRDLASQLHEPLRQFFEGDSEVEVIVERRSSDRRTAQARRRGPAPVTGRVDRRQIRGLQGRRAGDRRAAVVALDAPSLPRKVRRHADRLLFLERCQPTEQHLEDLDTARLVARIQGGDKHAFGELYLRYFDRIYQYLKIIFKDAHEAEDATQQVFMKVLEALPRYEPRGNPFRGWLFTVARNFALSELRKLRRVEVEDPTELNRSRPEEVDGELDAVSIDWITDRELMMFVERLPQAQRQVLVLRYMLDLTTAETAEVLGRNTADVRKLQHRALRFLQERLTSLGRSPRGTRPEREAWRRRLGQVVVLRERRFALRP